MLKALLALTLLVLVFFSVTRMIDQPSGLEKQLQVLASSDLDNIEKVLLSYKNENGRYPDNLFEIEDGFLVSIPLDPFDEDYVYTKTSTGYVLKCCKVWAKDNLFTRMKN